MATLSTVAVDFIANTGKYIQGLENINRQTKSWASNTDKQTKNANDSFQSTAKALDRLGKQFLAVFSTQKLVSAFSDILKNTSMLVDEAEKVGASVAQFTALDVAVKRNGATIGDVKVAYKELQKSINEALNGAKETTKAFNDLGISYSYISTLSPDERFLAIADALSKVTDENKRNELGIKLLGKSYTELAPIIAKGRDGIVNAAKGSSTPEEIIKLDRLNKQYEEVSRTIEQKFKQTLISLTPSLTSISDSLIFIIKNIEGVAKAIAIAFSPIILASFATLIINVANAVSTYTKAQIAANTAALFFQTTLLRIAIPSVLLSGLGALSVALKAVAAGFAAVSAAAGVVLGAVAAITGAFLLLFKTFAIGNELFADLLEYFGASDETIKKYRDKAIYQNEIVSASIEEIFKKLGFSSEETKNSFENLINTQKQFSQEANDATLIIDKEEQALKDLAKAEMELTEASISDMASRAKAIEESILTPSELYERELDRAREVFQSGMISYETYQKEINRITKNARKSTEELLSTPAQLVKRQILEFGRQYAEGIISLEEAQRAIELTTANAGKSVRDFIRTPIEEAKQKILDFAVSYQDGFITIEEATMATDKVIKDMGQSIVNYIAKPGDEVRVRIGNIIELYEAGFITLEQSTAALAKSSVELWEATNPGIMKAYEFMSGFADQFARAIVEGENFADAFKNVFKSVLKDIQVLILRTLILQAIMASIGLATGSINSEAAQSFGRLTGLIPKKDGGSVRSGGSYLVGEDGPEMFVPRSNGMILPNDFQGGGEQINVVQNINIQTGVAQTVRAEMIGLLPRFKQEAMAGVLDAKQRGGSYAKGLAAA